MNENTYGSRLLIAMEAKNATRKDLATALGVSVQAVGDVLRGKSGAFTAENNAKSAHYLGVNPNWLATGKGQMEFPSEETTTYLLAPGAKQSNQPLSLTGRARSALEFRGRLLKVIFVFKNGNLYLKSAYEANEKTLHIYTTRCKS